jgi:DNA-3-methyladenine glycosylase II
LPRLRKAGLSAPKIRALKAIAAACDSGLDLDALAHAPAEEAHARLTAVHGVGPWTADIYLLFCLGHADAFPAGDLAVQEAARIALNLRKRPNPERLTKIAEAWRPWRGVAAHLMWAYYHVVKRREGISLEPNTKSKTKSKTKPKPKSKTTKTKGKTNGRRAKP